MIFRIGNDVPTKSVCQTYCQATFLFKKLMSTKLPRAIRLLSQLGDAALRPSMEVSRFLWLVWLSYSICKLWWVFIA